MEIGISEMKISIVAVFSLQSATLGAGKTASGQGAGTSRAVVGAVKPLGRDVAFLSQK